jgi:nicotinate-nucleotide adenylyltransferase
MKVGLFFGSFNPIHIGHLIIANVMVELSDLEEVWFVVSPQNPLKSSKSLAHEFDRLDMVELAVEDNYHMKVTDVEFNMPRPSYTIDTLAYLSEKYPQHEFKLIIGEDNLVSFPRWKNYELILKNYGLYVYPRPCDVVEEHIRNHPNVKMIPAPIIDVSATFIRECLKNNKSIQYLVPDKVVQFIYDRKLFV